MARTGLRVSEVVSLNKTNINAEIDEKGLLYLILLMKPLMYAWIHLW